MLSSLPAGLQVGEYEIVRPLGEGGMGQVYEAVHPIIGKRAAIKVMRGRAVDALNEARRLLEEARAVNAIRHRGIVDIFGANVLPDGRPYLVMELLEGSTFAELAQRRLPMREVFDLLEGALLPLAAAHKAGIIHRDLKPSNLFLATDGEERRVKLLDFGVARREGRGGELTHPDVTLGSLGFMGPEHLSGEPVPQSDLYSLGCVAWLLLTGEPVFPYEAPPRLIRQHMETKPPSVQQVRADVSDELAYWVGWLLEKDAQARPFSADVALAALREAAVMSLGETTVSSEIDYVAVVQRLDARARKSAPPKRADPQADVITQRVPALKPDDTRPTKKK